MRRILVALGLLVVIGVIAACINLPFDVQDGCIGPVSWQDSIWILPDSVPVRADSGLAKICWQ